MEKASLAEAARIKRKMEINLSVAPTEAITSSWQLLLQIFDNDSFSEKPRRESQPEGLLSFDIIIVGPTMFIRSKTRRSYFPAPAMWESKRQ